MEDNHKQTEFQSYTKQNCNTFLEMLEQNIALSLEKQGNLADIIDSKSWQFDMNEGTISFEDIILPIQIIGSLSFNNNSWMWGWANSKSGIPENLLIQSNKLKAIGEEKNIEELTNPHFHVEENFEHKIGMIACGIFNSKSYYCANYGQGTLVVTIDDDAIPAIDKSKPEKVMTNFPQAISSFDVNHKNVFINYLIDREIPLKITNNSIEGKKDNNIIIANFDELNRLTSLNGELK